MKRIITALILIVLIFSLSACRNVDYTTAHTSNEYTIVDYYTAAGDLYQTIEFNKMTGSTIITTYFWKYDNGRRFLDKIEINTIDAEGEIVD